MELEVFKAIAAVAKDLCGDGIAKGRKNQQQGYSFRGIDDMYNVIAPVLVRHNLCVFPSYSDREVREQASKSGGVLFYVTLKGQYEFVSALDGSRHTVSTFGEAMDSGDKATNKAMSAAFKYALMQTFTIPTEGDNDADATTHAPGSRAAAQTVAQQKIAEMSPAMDRDDLRAAGDIAEKVLNETLAAAPKAKGGSKQFDMLTVFSKIKEELGEETYYRVLGNNGYKKSNEIPNKEIGRKIYAEMASLLNDRKVEEQSNAVRQ